MKHQVIEASSYILDHLEKNYAVLELLKSKFSSNSLIKIHSKEELQLRNIFSSKPLIKKTETLLPNSNLISWFESLILEVHEELSRVLHSVKTLKESSKVLYKQITVLIERCFHLHLHFNYFNKGHLDFFKDQLKPSKELTLHQIEAYIFDTLLDVMIVYRQIIDETRQYVKEMECVVDTNI
jgi:hypothetical protein